MQEVKLPGGRTTGAVRIGDVVRKPASAWTPTVHAVLRHLEERGFAGAPRALGIDDDGRELLSFLPGETIGDSYPWPDWVYADSTLVQVGRWLRQVHDLTAVFDSPEDAIWFIGDPMRPGFVVGHQDAAPYNAVMDGDRLVGFIDWDIASPSPRELDIAFSLLLWVPFASPGNGGTGTDRRERVHLLLDAYGYDADRSVFATVVPQRARRQAEVIRGMGDTPLLSFAVLLEGAADDVDELPETFWT
jgi:hypothetical protein